MFVQLIREWTRETYGPCGVHTFLMYEHYPLRHSPLRTSILCNKCPSGNGYVHPDLHLHLFVGLLSLLGWILIICYEARSVSLVTLTLPVLLAAPALYKSSINQLLPTTLFTVDIFRIHFREGKKAPSHQSRSDEFSCLFVVELHIRRQK